MQVSFTKLNHCHYAISAVRANGQRMLGPGPRGEAPGYDNRSRSGLGLGVFDRATRTAGQGQRMGICHRVVDRVGGD